MKTILDTIDLLIGNEQVSFDEKTDCFINADLKVREEFECDEPIHLFDAYYIGDASEDALNEVAKKNGCEDYKGLLIKMDGRYSEILEDELKNILDRPLYLEVYEDGEMSIYATESGIEKAKEEYEDHLTELVEAYTAFPYLFKFVPDEREYDIRGFRDITTQTDGLLDFVENGGFEQKAWIEGVLYFKVKNFKTGDAEVIYYENGELKQL